MFIGHSTFLELAQGFGLVTPDPFSSHELGVSIQAMYLQFPNNRIILRNTSGQSGAPDVQLALGVEGGSYQPLLQGDHRLAH